jgi:hypothetical protein
MVALYGGKLVTPATWNQMITPAKTSDGKPTIYGYGWFVGGPISSYHGLREVGHGGDVQGFASALYAIPEKQFAVVVLSNGEKESASTEYIASARWISEPSMPRTRIFVPEGSATTPSPTRILRASGVADPAEGTLHTTPRAAKKIVLPSGAQASDTSNAHPVATIASAVKDPIVQASPSAS